MQNYADCVKWIITQTINDVETVRGLYVGDSWIGKVPVIEESRTFDTTPIGDMKKSVFAIYRNCDGWWDKKPRRLLDLRDKRDWPIQGCGGIINAVNSDFTINR